MKKFLTTAVFVAFLFGANAQKKVGGEWSIGPRLGGSSGLSLKKHGGTSAFEFIAANSFDKEVEGFSLTVLFEKLAPLNGNGQLSALFGAGMNLTFADVTQVGVSGVLGFDWRLKTVPITMQVDWMPTLYFVNGTYFSGVNGAFTIRYILNHKKYDDKSKSKKSKSNTD
ncbi:MAG: hypothetical protein NTZ41_00665 [Sphingobacteriales bacterium]|jgi:hypothetical protein|nr:hypothetical protein [Sphingobacteriales bacterium]